MLENLLGRRDLAAQRRPLCTAATTRLDFRLSSIQTTQIYAKVDVCDAISDRSAVAGGAAMLTKAVESYIAMRRACGFAFQSEGTCLQRLRRILRCHRPHASRSDIRRRVGADRLDRRASEHGGSAL